MLNEKTLHPVSEFKKHFHCFMNQDFWLACSSVQILFAVLRAIKPVASIGVLPYCLLFSPGLKNLPYCHL